jgi:DNA-binding XRE family transcriptional regulator
VSPPGKSPPQKPPDGLTPEDLDPIVQRELKRLGTKLRAARHAKGLSQEQAAEMIGIHPKYMPRLESGGANPTVSTLVAASVAYGIPVREFFTDDEGT